MSANYEQKIHAARIKASSGVLPLRGRKQPNAWPDDIYGHDFTLKFTTVGEFLEGNNLLLKGAEFYKYVYLWMILDAVIYEYKGVKKEGRYDDLAYRQKAIDTCKDVIEEIRFCLGLPV